MSRFFIGVAWPYANGVIHAGHVAGALLPADIFSKFQRMLGNQVLMVSGSDEHGTPITVTAEKEHKTPQEIVDKYHIINKNAIEQLGISFELYTRTTSETHKKVVQEFFKVLYNNGYIYTKTMISPYCKNCSRFLPDTYIEGTCPYCGYDHARGDQCEECGKTLDPQDLIQPKCRICGATPIFKQTKHMFFKLTAFQKELERWIDTKTYWRDNVINFTRNFLASGLIDRAITRDLDWGIQVPISEFANKKIYVWFDAVIGYLSASIAYSEKIHNVNYWLEFWKNAQTKHYYFIGKDNIPFHTIIWPAMLMAYGGLNLPYDVPASEYLRFDGTKFSKSRDIGITIPELLEHFDPDMIRFYLSLNLPETRDFSFKLSDFVNSINQELIDKFGNFVHRVLMFTTSRFNVVPECGSLDREDTELLEHMHATVMTMYKLLNQVKLKKAFKAWNVLIKRGNVYFNNSAPWDLYKTDISRCKTKLHIALRLLKLLAITGAPFLPFTMQKLWNMLGYAGQVSEQSWNEALADITQNELKKPEILFKKLVEMPVYNDWNKLDIRVGKIKTVLEHPNADKLYILKVEVGTDTRTLVAGLREFYKKEELVNRDVLVLYNLEPAKIRNVKSEGMLLAADDTMHICLLKPENVPTGTRVQANKIVSTSSKTLKYKSFAKMKFEVGLVIKVRSTNITVLGSKEYVIHETFSKHWENKMCVLFFDHNRPMILHTGNKLITLDREIALGSKVR